MSGKKHRGPVRACLIISPRSGEGTFHLDEALPVLLAQGWDVIAADARGEIADPPPRRAILAFGSEGSGLSPALATVARMIAIRMSLRMESLNVGSSAAILLARSYELRS